MSIYVVGDIQGCYEPLRRLLDCVSFDPTEDELWAVGDLINRGSDNLRTVRFLRSLGKKFVGVLGNHDLHFLAVAFNGREQRRSDTFADILAAPDRHETVAWFRRLKVMHRSANQAMVHAGLLPNWTLDDASRFARELEDLVRGPAVVDYLRAMYGNEPARFEQNLSGWARARVLTNIFTRMRFCDQTGRLDLNTKGGWAEAPSGMKPWFTWPTHREKRNEVVLFGHWAALGGETMTTNAIALDTGCVWGEKLTALRLSDRKKFSVTAEP